MAIKRIATPDEVISFCGRVELGKSLCCLGDRLKVSGGNKAAVRARTTIKRIKFRECGCYCTNAHFLTHR